MTEPEATPDRDQTVLTDPPWVWPLLWVGFPLAGAGGALLLKLAAAAAAGWPRLPLPGWLRFVAEAPEPWASLGTATVGLLAGLFFVAHVQQDRLAVRVGEPGLRLARSSGEVTEVTRAEITAVFLDGKQLVVLGPAREELVREAYDLDRAELGRALIRHGYPWQAGGDPHRDEFQRWVPGLPGLPPGADGLFRAREKALAKDDLADAAELRTDLSRLGLVVRDEKSRQYWRRHDRPAR